MFLCLKASNKPTSQSKDYTPQSTLEVTPQSTPGSTPQASPPRPRTDFLLVTQLLPEIYSFFDEYDIKPLCHLRELSKLFLKQVDSNEGLWSFFMQRNLKCRICLKESSIWRDSMRCSGLQEARRLSRVLILSRQSWSFKFTTRVMVSSRNPTKNPTVDIQKLMTAFLRLEHRVLLSEYAGKDQPCFHTHADDISSVLPTSLHAHLPPYKWKIVKPVLLRRQFKRFCQAISYIIDMYHSVVGFSPHDPCPVSSIFQPHVIAAINDVRSQVTWCKTVLQSHKKTQRVALCCFTLSEDHRHARVSCVVFLRPCLAEDMRALFFGW